MQADIGRQTEEHTTAGSSVFFLRSRETSHPGTAALEKAGATESAAEIGPLNFSVPTCVFGLGFFFFSVSKKVAVSSLHPRHL